MTEAAMSEDPKPFELPPGWQERALAAVPEGFDDLSDEDKQKYFDALEAKEAHQRQIERCREIADELIPARYRRSIEFRPEISEWLEEFWGPLHDDEVNGLLLIGRPGCGKTQTVWGIVRNLLDNGWDQFRVEEMSDLFDELTALSRAGRSDQELIKSLCSTDLLILDDLGAKPLTEFREERLLKILNKRWDRKLPTIVTTNIVPANFKEHFGDRSSSRLEGMCRVVVFPNIDRRTGVDYSRTKDGER
jgi:DNA replication protein DnaC